MKLTTGSEGHVLVSWDIHATGDAAKGYEARLAGAMEGFESLRIFPNLCIVVVENEAGRKALVENFGSFITEGTDVAVTLLVSPVIYSKSYEGWLPENAWTRIAEVA
jgi:amino acid transporter